MFSSAVRRAATRGASCSLAAASPSVNSLRFVALPTQVSVGSAAQLRVAAWRAFSAEAGGEKQHGDKKQQTDDIPPEDDIPLADPDLSSAFGEITRARGIDTGRGEGRRNYVPSHTYERSGKSYTRIKFQIDNASKRSATVFAEVAHDRSTSTDFNYLMVQMDRSKQVLTLVDNRKPEKSRDMRQYDVAVKLQHDGATFYSGGPLHDATSEQMQILGPHMDYMNTVRCDLNEGRCEADGYSAGTLVYRTKPHKAPLGLDDLEAMVGLDRYTRGNT